MKHIILLFSFLFCTLLFASGNTPDYRLLRKINHIDNKFVHHTSDFLSKSAPYFSIGVPAGIGLYALIAKNDKSFFDAIYIGSSLCEAALLTYGLKYSVRRDRPFKTHNDIIQRDHVGSYSFPSGHTSTAFSIATSLSINYPKWYVIAPSMLWACGVGFARMYEGVHYPSDVLCGAILGAGTAWLNYRLNQWLFKEDRRKIFHRR